MSVPSRRLVGPLEKPAGTAMGQRRLDRSGIVKFISPETVALFRRPGLCEYCFRRCHLTEPHHCFARGRGDAFRMDLSENLIALCFECHRAFHFGAIQRDDLLAVIAAREGLWPPDLRDILTRLRWA
jgi:hypothetical protein